MKKTQLIIMIFFAALMPGKIFSQNTLFSEAQFKDYFLQHKDSLDMIEGIWSVSTSQEYYRYDTLYDIKRIPKSAKVAVMKKGNVFESYNLAGESSDVQFTTTEIKGVYFYKNYFKETEEFSKADAVISKEGEMEYKYDFPEKLLKMRLGESYEEGTRVTNITKWKRIFPDKKK